MFCDHSVLIFHSRISDLQADTVGISMPLMALKDRLQHQTITRRSLTTRIVGESSVECCRAKGIKLDRRLTLFRNGEEAAGLTRS